MTSALTQALRSAADTTVVAMGPGDLTATPRIFSKCFGDATALVVADERTMAVAGDAVVQLLRQAGVQQLPPHVYPGSPELYASYDNCIALRDTLAQSDAIPIAVGAGTLNDIVKRASSEVGRSYLVVCTAASMDGYTAFGASLAVDGFKQTFSCPAPRGCVADITVMGEAPDVMIGSGYGDLIGKITAGADWIIADAVGEEPIDVECWRLVQEPLHASLAKPEALLRRDRSTVANLVEGLLMSGLAMQAHESSRPASGSEHQFSHLWEMEGHGVHVTPRRLSHGYKVGLGTVAISALYEALLRRDLSTLNVDAAVNGWLDADDAEARIVAMNADSPLVGEMVNQSMAKWINQDQLRARLMTIRAGWPVLTERLRAQLIPPRQLQQMLRSVGAPATPDDIALDWDRFRDTYFRAQMIRKRYTVLDLVWEAGWLPDLVDELFASDGFWGQQAHKVVSPTG